MTHSFDLAYPCVGPNDETEYGLTKRETFAKDAPICCEPDNVEASAALAVAWADALIKALNGPIAAPQCAHVPTSAAMERLQDILERYKTFDDSLTLSDMTLGDLREIAGRK